MSRREPLAGPLPCLERAKLPSFPATGPESYSRTRFGIGLVCLTALQPGPPVGHVVSARLACVSINRSLCRQPRPKALDAPAQSQPPPRLRACTAADTQCSPAGPALTSFSKPAWPIRRPHSAYRRSTTPAAVARTDCKASGRAGPRVRTQSARRWPPSAES